MPIQKTGASSVETQITNGQRRLDPGRKGPSHRRSIPPAGRAYLVERGLEHDGYGALKALVADYVQQAKLLAGVPVALPSLN
jgi:hypothetical protein